MDARFEERCTRSDRPLAGRDHECRSELPGELLQNALFARLGVAGTQPEREAPAESQSPIQRAGERRSIRIGSGVSWERLTAEPGRDVDFLLLRYEPGGESAPPNSLMGRSGKGCGYVLSGRLRVTIAGESWELRRGDCVSVACAEPYRLAAVGDEPVELVWFAVGERLIEP